MPDTTTFGVSIAVPEPYGSRLREHRAAFGDPLAGTVPSHITLLPPDESPAAGLAAVREALAAVAARTAPFDLALGGTGTFRPVSPVVFVAVTAGGPETAALAHGLREAVGAPEPAFPFHPHVTVAHHLEDAALDRATAELSGFACEFTATEFALYLHDAEEGWTPHVTFALGGGR